MKVNHINLTVSDVPATAKFLETYFGMRDMGGNKGFTVLFDDDNLVLSLMQGKRSVGVTYPETFHIGFGQENEEAVDRMNERLKADGLDVEAPQHSHAYTFYVDAPGGFQIEVFC